MGALSNQLLAITILVYLAAMLCHAIEYAFGTSGAVARVAGVPAGAAASREPVMSGGARAPVTAAARREPVAATAAVAADRGRVVVGVESPGGRQLSEVAGARDAPGAVAGPGSGFRADRRRATLAGRAAVALTVAGVGTHAATLVTRGLAAGRVPWGNMYEFVLAACLVGAVAWLAVLVARPRLRHLGLFVTLPLVVLLGLAGMNLYTAAGPLVPALNSYWLKIHVSAAAVAAGVLLVGFVLATLVLTRSGYDAGRRGFPCSLGERLPAADVLERLTFRVHVFAFPIWTFAIICGAVWAEAAWGRYWGWDPKETWSFIAWVVYAGYLHARATPSVKRTTTAWIAVAGWATMMINLFGVNLVISGLHSYAGV